MVNMARKITAGEYQIGIWNVRRVEGRRWESRATGPGTLGDGSPQRFATLADAHLALTGEAMRDGDLDGTSGQDRSNYSDTQDRESYS